MTSSRILILMSTYQGEKYLGAQLDSIIAQDIPDWILLIRDDGSTDKTLAIIDRYTKIDARIQKITDSLGNLKPAQSFSVLMKEAKQRLEPFILFADQDDVWLPNKLRLTIDAFEKESEHTPLLVFSDLCVVDNDLKVIHPSYLQREKLKPEKTAPLHILLLHNYITGCAMGMNRALLAETYPVPQTAIMHDWWCALLASALGKIIYINEATLLYRQHEQNDIGSQGFYSKFKNLTRIKNSIYPRIEQANSLLQRLPKTHPCWHKIALFCSLPDSSFFSKLKKIFHLKLKTDGFIRQCGFLFFILFLKKQAHPDSFGEKTP